jgi:hypothetical protein
VGFSDEWAAVNEDVSDTLRSIGFHIGLTGSDFLSWYRDNLDKRLRDFVNDDDSNVAAPDLKEQIENDPTVR